MSTILFLFLFAGSLGGLGFLILLAWFAIDESIKRIREQRARRHCRVYDFVSGRRL